MLGVIGIFCNQPLLMHSSRDCLLTMCKLHVATTAPFNAPVRGFRGRFALRAGVWRMIFVFGLTLAAVVLIFVVHDLSIVISFAGLAGCIPMSFIIPPLCFLRMYGPRSWRDGSYRRLLAKYTTSTPCSTKPSTLHTHRPGDVNKVFRTQALWKIAAAWLTLFVRFSCFKSNIMAELNANDQFPRRF